MLQNAPTCLVYKKYFKPSTRHYLSKLSILQVDSNNSSSTTTILSETFKPTITLCLFKSSKNAYLHCMQNHLPSQSFERLTNHHLSPRLPPRMMPPMSRLPRKAFPQYRVFQGRQCLNCICPQVEEASCRPRRQDRTRIHPYQGLFVRYTSGVLP